MDFNAKPKFIQTQIEKHKKLLHHEKSDISLTSILSSEKCQRIISECRLYRDRVYTPLKTILIFIKQVLSADKSCKHAVAGIVAECVAQEIIAPSSNTGPYCKARRRLPESVVRTLVRETGEKTKNKSSKKWRWRNRNVHIADGTTVTIPDTKENRKKFLRHTNHAGEVGFPMVRLVVIISLAVGTILDYAIGASRGEGTGEHSLLRSILSCLKNGDVLLGDSYYPSFFLIAELVHCGIDGVFPGLTGRKYDFRKGFYLGKNDHIVEWKKPTKPKWMDKETYDAYPRLIRTREFKANGRVYVTTMLEHKKFNKKELALLYEFRWQVELKIRDIKTTMNMDMLSCKTPEMVSKEIGIHFLGYNLIRILIAEACAKHNFIPYKISFKGTVQLLNQFMPYFTKTISDERLFSELLKLIVRNEVGNRPGRLEPRAVKSERRKTFRTMKKCRTSEKRQLERKRRMRLLKHDNS